MDRSLPESRIEWREGSAICTRFGDVYYSRHGGLGESEHVFLAGNGLPDRWRSGTDFTIVETGFGTGLNFLATLAHWQRRNLTDSRLRYIAVEGYPLAKADVGRISGLWPQLGDSVEALCDRLPARAPGRHGMEFENGQVEVTLIYGLLADSIQELVASAGTVDAWYLDGFSPQRNPEMWTSELFSTIKQLSKPGTTCATYTVARAVREGLARAGFQVSKAPGFGHKRDMLRAVLGP